MSGESPDHGWDAVRVAAGDNVAVALRVLRGEARVLLADRVQHVALVDDIPIGHKFALADLPAGTAIIKYGSVIGTLSRKVTKGEHVHVHNLVSARVQNGTTTPLAGSIDR